MKKINLWLGILAITLVFGMTVFGCGGGGGGGGGDGPIDGTWIGDNGESITLKNGNFEVLNNNKAYMKGTYTTVARSLYDISITVTGMHGDVLNQAIDEDITFQSQWYNKNQILALVRDSMKAANVSDLEITNTVNGYSAALDEIFTTFEGTIVDDTMTLDGETYTKVPTGGGGGGGETASGGFTVTGIPAKYEGKYARFTGGDGNIMLTGYQTKTSNDIILPQIKNGRVTIPLWDMRTLTNPSTWVSYKGNDTLMAGTVLLYNSGSDKATQNSSQKEITSVVFMFITFSNGNLTVSWDEGMEIPQ